MEKSILIVNARIVNEGAEHEGDLLIRNGRIARQGGDLSSLTAARVIDAQGKLLMPGMIDDQVHFREPGLTHKGDIHSESRAAVAGGITSFMEMPNTTPPTTTMAAVADKRRRAAQNALGNYAFYLGATNHNIDAIRAADPRLICGVKVFMGASTGDMLVDDPHILERIFSEAPTIVATHCEDTPTIKANEAKFRRRFGADVPIAYHPDIRSREACLKSTTLALALARRCGTRLHVLHLTTADELALFPEGPMDAKRITAEVCIHHLHFDRRDYETRGSLIKCNPAIKDAADREALIAGVQTGQIDVIATDHAPHTLDEKRRPYFEAPAGLPLVQHALPALLEHWQAGRFSLPLIAEKTSHAVARRFKLVDRGFIREGYWADLVLVDPQRPHTVADADILARCGWSPFAGQTWRSSVFMTLVNGRIVFEQGRLREPGTGMALEFDIG
jgi:dihydroorotase